MSFDSQGLGSVSSEAHKLIFFLPTAKNVSIPRAMYSLLLPASLGIGIHVFAVHSTLRFCFLIRLSFALSIAGFLAALSSEAMVTVCF